MDCNGGKNMVTRRICILCTLLVLVLQLAEAPRAHALLKIDKAANDILFSSDEGTSTCTPASATSLQGDDNLEKILRFYIGKGLTLAQASGIAGNYKAESGFNPAVIEGGAIAPDDYTPVNGVGFGIAQWTFTARQQPLVDLGKSTNRKITDLSLQLDYSWQEMEKGIGRFTLDEYKKVDAPDEAAFVFHRDFEVSDDSREAVRENRMNPAQSIYNSYQASLGGAGTASSTGSSTSTASTAACTTSTSNFLDDNSFKIYDQCDPQWGSQMYASETICASACGPSSMAMIITALTGKEVTPPETAKVSHEKGTSHISGSSWDISEVLSEHWGLTWTHIPESEVSVAKINEVLSDGKTLINTSGAGSAPFTSGGHFITIRGVTPDGKWKVGNSNGPGGLEDSKKEWDPEYILSMMRHGNVYAITKLAKT